MKIFFPMEFSVACIKKYSLVYGVESQVQCLNKCLDSPWPNHHDYLRNFSSNFYPYILITCNKFKWQRGQRREASIQITIILLSRCCGLSISTTSTKYFLLPCKSQETAFGFLTHHQNPREQLTTRNPSKRAHFHPCASLHCSTAPYNHFMIIFHLD